MLNEVKTVVDERHPDSAVRIPSAAVHNALFLAIGARNLGALGPLLALIFVVATPTHSEGASLAAGSVVPRVQEVFVAELVEGETMSFSPAYRYRKAVRIEKPGG